ncbi:MAG TPA: DUF5700 domain-containing putative Zn-dependent protease [Thermoanaerobaculia bacterium]
MAALTLAVLPAAIAPAETPDRVPVRMDTSEADMVLQILRELKAGGTIEDEQWKRLFETNAFRRLQAREASMNRSLTREDFKAFVTSDALAAKAEALSATLDLWRKVDVRAAVDRALVYLPPDTPIRATIYPVIKPQPNSFVFQNPEPSIFLAVDPAVTPAKLANTLTHELHHIGFAAACPPREAERDDLSDVQQLAAKWLSAFGEGFAMLAAAGSPDADPQAASLPQDRARWQRDLRRADEDLVSLDRFFRDVLQGRLTAEKADERGFSFFGEQGPWYTVGYRMAVTIERAFGRAELIRAFCDVRLLPATYNRAADKLEIKGPRWSEAVAGAWKKPAA